MLQLIQLIFNNLLGAAFIYALFALYRVNKLYKLSEEVYQKSSRKDLSVFKSEKHAKLMRKFQENEIYGFDHVFAFHLKHYGILLSYAISIALIIGLAAMTLNYLDILEDAKLSTIAQISAIILFNLIYLKRENRNLEKLSDILDTYPDKQQ